MTVISCGRNWKITLWSGLAAVCISMGSCLFVKMQSNTSLLSIASTGTSVCKIVFDSPDKLYKALKSECDVASGASTIDSQMNSFMLDNGGSLLSRREQKSDVLDVDRLNQLLLYDVMGRSENSRAYNFNDSNSVRIDPACWRSLRLFCGDRASPAETLVARIDRTSTKAGSVYLKRLIAQPTDDIKLLRKRQNAVKFLVNNPAILQAVRKSLMSISDVEPRLLHFWSDTITNSNGLLGEHKGMYWEHSSYANKILPKRLLVAADRSVAASSLTRVGSVAADVLKYPFMSSCVASGLTYSFTLMRVGVLGTPLSLLNPFPVLWNTYKSLPTSLSEICFHQTLPFFGKVFSSGLLLALWVAVPAYQGVKNVLKLHRSSSPAQRDLAGVRRILCNSRNILSLLSRAGCAGDFSLCSTLWDFVERQVSPDAADLLSSLSTSTFKGRPSVFSNHGRILKAYKQMHELRDEFGPLVEAIAEIDCYASIATLYNEYQNSDNKYCFVNYESSMENGPHLHIEDMWYPFIEAKKAVANSVELGGNSVRNRVISGPNAGGKSTFLSGVMFAALFGQSCGIAPAKSVSFTPFSYYDTYMNLEDSPADGRSLFQKQVDRIAGIVSNLRSVGTGKSSLVVTDELFTGTNPRDASVMSIKVMDILSNLPGSLNLISTHFEEVAQAADGTYPDVFDNCHVSVKRDNGGRLVGYSYKVSPGFTTDTNAYDIFQGAGLA